MIMETLSWRNGHGSAAGAVTSEAGTAHDCTTTLPITPVVRYLV
ncbi:MAG TPA: hypothetical protein VFV73_01670 [Streptosporangiaceae bacterium]|nr:hypothetical protein [Streptosporangiaceae bacterium]